MEWASAGPGLGVIPVTGSGPLEVWGCVQGCCVMLLFLALETLPVLFGNF